MIIIGPLINVVYDLLGLYKLALFMFIVVNWLEAFGIVNRYNGFVYGIQNFLHILSKIHSLLTFYNKNIVIPIYCAVKSIIEK